MKRHQVMANTEVMKHLPIMTRSSVREIMLQHERTFKEQVHDLHKLYNVQRLLMEKAKSMGLVVLSSALSESPSCKKRQELNVFQEPHGDKGTGALRIGMFGQIMPGIVNEKSSCTKSSVRKRKIDLEQIPEDDTDDEMENQATLNLLAYPKLGSSSYPATSKQNQSSNYNTTVQSSVDQMGTQLTSSVYSDHAKPPIAPAYDFIGIEKKDGDKATEIKNVNAAVHNNQDNYTPHYNNYHLYFQGAQGATTDMNITSTFMNQMQYKGASLHPSLSFHFHDTSCDRNVQPAQQGKTTSSIVQDESVKSSLRSVGLLDMSLGCPLDKNSQKWPMSNTSQIHGYPISASTPPGDVKANSIMAGKSSANSLEQTRGIWYPPNPFMEAGSQYQASPQAINQAPRLESSNGAFYLQQMGYGLQGNSTRNWINMHPALGHHFSTVVSIPQNLPLKPVVAVKNDMDLLCNNDTGSQKSKITSSEHISLTLEATQNVSDSKTMKDKAKPSTKSPDFEPGLQLSRNNDESKEPDQERVKPSGSSAFSSWSKAKDHNEKTKTSSSGLDNISMSLAHSNPGTATVLTAQTVANRPEELPDLKFTLSV